MDNTLNGKQMKKANWVKTQNRKTIEIICQMCGLNFKKALSEYNRNEQNGKGHFCSLSCSSTHRNLESPRDIPESFKENWGISHEDDCTPFRYYLKAVRSRKHEVDIDCEYLSNLWKEQKGKCNITNIPIILKTHAKSSKDFGMRTASLDRIDSSKGYIKGNVQFLAVAINYMKGSRTDNEVVDFINEICNC